MSTTSPGRELPNVSVVIPVLNEERHISDCLESVLTQDYPPELVEIVVADGGSTDRTREIVEAAAARDPRIRIIDNPGRNQAAGLNRAIAVTDGAVVARLDGHAAWRPQHLRRCVELLTLTGADNVGGTMEAAGETFVARAAGRASSSRFGVGGARYRYASAPMETETVFLGCFRRSALVRVGAFDERLSIHEDYDLNQRIRSSGGKIVFSPELPTTYWTRTSWASLSMQFFRYGRAKATVARMTPAALRPYHLVPPMAVAAIPVLGMLSVSTKGRRVAAGVAASYAVVCAAASIRAGRGQPRRVRALIPLVFPVLQGSWGLGFLIGLFGRRLEPMARTRDTVGTPVG